MSPIAKRRDVLFTLSVDTEEDNWEPTRTNLTVDNIRALPRFVAFLRKLNVRPTLFATYQVLHEAWAGTILKDLEAAGDVEIGTHLHPWNTPPVVEPLHKRYTMLNNLPRGLQRLKLERLTAKYQEVLRHSPVSFRAGRFALGAEILGGLAELGYQVDSSVTPLISWAALQGPTFIGAPLTPYRLGLSDDPRLPSTSGPVVELPLSTGFTLFRSSAWTAVDWMLNTLFARVFRIGSWAARLRVMRRIVLTPETSSVREMLALSRSLLDGGAPHLHMFLHSPSLIPGNTPYVRSKKGVEALYGAVERYVAGLARIANVRPITLGEASAAMGFLPRPAETSPAGERPIVRVAAGLASGWTGASVHPPGAAGTRRRLLVITYHFPPDGAVGGLRWAALTKYLERLGWETCVLTAAEGSSRDGPGRALVSSCPRGRTIVDLYRRLAVRRDRDGEADGRGAGRRGLRDELVAALSLPDESRGWVLRAARRARALIGSFQPNVVVSSGPPHSAHLVARLATARRGIRWLVDLRDPWPQMVSPIDRWDPVQGTLLARLLMPRVERTVIAAADGVLANTQVLTNRLAARYPNTPVVWVRNGFDPERMPPEPLEQDDRLLISYIGTLYGNRSLDVVLHALRRYVDRRSLPPGAVLLQVAGDSDEPHRAAFHRAVSELRLEEYVVFRGPLPGPEALQLVHRSDLALVLGQDQSLQVPAKLYECIGMGVPTLVVAERGSATAQEANSLGAFAADPDDAQGIETVVARVHRRSSKERPAPPPEILYPLIAEQVSRLLSDPDFFLFHAWSEAGREPHPGGERTPSVPEPVREMKPAG